MLTNTFSCPNQKNANHVRILPLDTCSVSDMLKINLFTKLDDCKVNKSKLIYDKCGKDLKCKIDDKTMNELKKCFKFEIGDKTKNELKENIKSEIEKGLKFEIGNETKNALKDEIKGEIIDGIDWCNIIDLCNHDGTLESKLITPELKANCPTYQQGDMDKPGWFTRDLLKQFLPNLMSNKKITDHFGEKGVEQYYAENFAITFKSEEGTKCGSNVNYTWSIASNMWCDKINESGSSTGFCPKDFSNEKTSVCCPSGLKTSACAENFFLNNKCPNLILDLEGEELKACAGKTIVAKLESPLIITDYYKNIIDKNGNKIGINYNQLKPHLNPDGTMKDCGDNADCQKYAKIIDKILWTSDKEVKLTIPGNKVGGKTSEEPEPEPEPIYSEGMAFPHYGYGNDLI